MAVHRVAVHYLLLVAGLLCLPIAADAAALDAYFGAFVGRAVVEDLDSGSQGLRDFDFVIAPTKRGGFTIEWLNVELVDGRRDVEGVVRRHGQLSFARALSASHFIEEPAYNPFKEKDELAPISGDPLRWAVVDEDGLQIISFVILDDGRYEVQRTVRKLTGKRLDLDFERIVDGAVVRRIVGHGYRVD